MATPRGAQHRDLEGRLGSLEDAVRTLTTAALSRAQQNVTEGDFTVSGGGRILVRDGGDLWVMFPDAVAEDLQCVVAGDIYEAGTSNYEGTGLLVQTANGDDIADLRTTLGNLDRGQAEFGQLGAPLTHVWCYTDAWYLNADDNIFCTADLDATLEAQQVVYLNGHQGISLDGHNVGIDMFGLARALDGLNVNTSLKYLGAPTTGAGANLNYNTSNGVFRVVVSSERFKENIRPAELDLDACEQLQEVIYTRRDEADEDVPPTYYGFIAERAHELGLTEFVGYDEDGEPYTFDYPTFAAVAHHAMLRRERQRREALEAQVADQERRLAALEAAAS